MQQEASAHLLHPLCMDVNVIIFYVNHVANIEQQQSYHNNANTKVVNHYISPMRINTTQFNS